MKPCATREHKKQQGTLTDGHGMRLIHRKSACHGTHCGTCKSGRNWEVPRHVACGWWDSPHTTLRTKQWLSVLAADFLGEAQEISKHGAEWEKEIELYSISADPACSRGSASEKKLPAARGKKSLEAARGKKQKQLQAASSKKQEARKQEEEEEEEEEEPEPEAWRPQFALELEGKKQETIRRRRRRRRRRRNLKAASQIWTSGSQLQRKRSYNKQQGARSKKQSLGARAVMLELVKQNFGAWAVMLEPVSCGFRKRR